MFSLKFLSRNRHVTAQTDGSGQNSSRNKLKKKKSQYQLIQNQHPVVDESIILTMGNQMSFENIPRPLRPPRSHGAAPPEIPDLPSLPIYETLNSCKKPEAPTAPASKLTEKPKTPSSGHRSQLLPATTKLTPVVQPNEGPPPYDRASMLADSYRSILPDFNTMNCNSSYARLKHRPTDINLRQIRHQTSFTSNRSHTSLDLSRRPDPNLPSIIHEVPSESSSTTALDSAETPMPASGPSDPPTPEIPPRAAVRPTSGTAMMGDIRQRPLVHSASFSPAPMQATFVASPPLPLSSPASSTSLARKNSEGATAGTDVALQICTDLLTEELSKAFLLSQHQLPGRQDTGSESDNQAAKLQVLLLIEAYEGVLENCRSHRNRDKVAARTRHYDEAVEILNHWLESLYAIYHEAFGCESEDRGKGCFLDIDDC
ncbi:hypothetical protein QBC35DRAFT_440668 [Podospora australis]|uniref:Uncharacterized protein n=1 Tax=Podospora australis TaxID=1536484 RepID=A0AAN7AFM7_9PEZI|nr:hypothetical protein QBC35DRAFT_440668 [Podospora australis]